MTALTPPTGLSEEQILLFNRLAERVAEKRLALPAVLFLESVRPLNFIGSQVMLFFQPMLRAFFTLREYDLIQQALEQRETISYLVELLEAKEDVAAKKERDLRALIKAEKKRVKELKKKK